MHAMLPSVWLTTSAPHSVTFRGSITRPVRSLSTLRSSDYSDRTPRKTRFPLVGQTLAGQDFHLLGCFRRFPLCASTHIVSSSSKLSWRTSQRAAGRPAREARAQLSDGRYAAGTTRPQRALQRSNGLMYTLAKAPTMDRLKEAKHDTW